MLPTVCLAVRLHNASRPAGARAVPRLALTLAGCAVAALAVTACAAQPDLRSVVDAGATYTTDQVEKVAAATPLGGAASITTQQGPAQRQHALAQLRRAGSEGVRTADLLTRTFPPGDSAVPVRIEHGQVDGVDALIVIEAAPGKAGTLTARRVWILGYRDGTVVDSASFR